MAVAVQRGIAVSRRRALLLTTVVEFLLAGTATSAAGCARHETEVAAREHGTVRASR
jgi:hypothetical protein